MFKNEDDLKKIINQLNINAEPNPAHKENLHRQMLSAFNKTRLRPLLRIGLRQIIRTTILKRPIIKLAAAAVIIIAVLAGLQHFTGSFDGSGVAWAHVAERVQQIRTCVFHLLRCQKQKSEAEFASLWIFMKVCFLPDGFFGRFVVAFGRLDNQTHTYSLG